MAELVLTAEQQRRVEIFEMYERISAPAREKRNRALDDFEREWREKWVQRFTAQEEARLKQIDKLRAEGVPEPQALALSLFEAAKDQEAYIVEKDAAARKLDESLERPLSWREFLKQQAAELPGDPTVATLLQEAQSVDVDAAVDGFLKSPPPSRVLSDLSAVRENDDVIAYKRGLQTAFRDVGARLDVQKIDDRDIEAALKVAAQKFDVEKGLLLTGDTAFKTRAAEIAGRLGLKLRNLEPEVLHAWEKGRKSMPELTRNVAPSVERGITGELADPRIDRVRGEQLLFIDPQAAKAWGKRLAELDAEFVSTGENKRGPEMMMATMIALRLPGDRVQEALARWRGVPHDIMQEFARADLSKPDGGLKLSNNARKVLVEREMIDEKGNLTPAGVDVILVRDDHVLRSRRDPALKQVFAPGVEMKTSFEFVREAAGELAAGKDRDLSKEADERQKVAERVEEREQAHEQDAPARKRRSQQRDVGVEL